MRDLNHRLVTMGLMEPEPPEPPGWFEVFIEHFRAFKAKKRHTRGLSTFTCSDGYKLGQRVGHIRSGGRQITPEQRAALDAEGFIWNASLVGVWWPGFIERFRAFKAENGHTKVLSTFTCSDGYELGQRVCSIRLGGRKLTEEQRAILDAEGFIWNVSREGTWWPAFIEHFRAFKAENGHTKVPQYHVCSEGYGLGKRVRDIRSGNNKPTDEQRVILDAEGFIWRARGSTSTPQA